ncbi:MAG: DUF4150 domain-containing protein, partial [Rhizobium sp.]
MADDVTVLAPIIVSPPVANPGFAADHGLPSNTLFEAYPDGSGYVYYGSSDAEDLTSRVYDERLVGTAEDGTPLSLKERLKEKEKEKPAGQPYPTAADPAPPEFIPDDSKAIAVCLSPDVCKSPDKPVPYMSWGKASDSQNYSPDVRSNGLAIKRQDSKFSCCYGDEPGVGLGCKSGTVGDVVEP